MSEDQALKEAFNAEFGPESEKELERISNDLQRILSTITKLPKRSDFAMIREYQRSISEAQSDIKKIAERIKALSR